MLILTEKSNVANDFAKALNCQKKIGYYSNERIEITYCVGHLFKLQEPALYEERFKSWKEIPCIPEKFNYIKIESVKKQTEIVISLLKKHKFDEILIATDADREGEIIARECLNIAGIFDFTKIKRFWVSQALTKEVILQGIKEAKSFSEYNNLAKNGFARQHSDWLVGINFTRYVSVASNKKLSIGRIKTALLSAIDSRCSKIENFQTEKYFEFYATLEATRDASKCIGIYFDKDNNTKFKDSKLLTQLSNIINKPAKVLENKIEKKEQQAPQLYNLNALQKDAFKYYEYSADETLKIIQKLYEEYKCVSYPRTPSRVMGSSNIELINKIFNELCNSYSDFNETKKISDISLNNKRCFNDKKLEAHHALIPLKNIPSSATEEEKNIYNLILNRFKIAFASPYIFNKQTVILLIDNYHFKVTGTQTIDLGWKNFITSDTCRFNNENETEETSQSLEKIDWNNLICKNIEAKEKYTKPPKYFNEASILSFMENPTSIDENTTKLVGLGTSATRHTFIPELITNGYIKIEKKNILITQLGRIVINSVKNSSIKSLANIEETTRWETFLQENPTAFEEEIKNFIKKAITEDFKIELPTDENKILCPICKNPLFFGTTKTGIKNWFCTGYKNGCTFKIWQEFSGTKLSEKDVRLLCSNKKTPLKNFISKKTKKEFKASLYLDSNYQIKFDFS